MKDRLERVEIPGSEDARQRAWSVVEAAFSEREPAERRARRLRPALALAAAAALVAAALSPPGRAVVGEIREVVGVERARPALFSLPAPGRLLVASDAGVWVVQRDGSKRLLGDYEEASWSPFGRFVVAARENELAALEPDGDVRWTIARPGVGTPRWAGTETDTRIAYVDRTGIRVVAGDGTGDRLVVPGASGPLAWRPGRGFALAHATPRLVRVVDVDTGELLWQRRHAVGSAARLEWSGDGHRLLLVGPRAIVVYDEGGSVPYELRRGAAPVQDAALSPGGLSLVLAQTSVRRSQVWIVPRLRPDAGAARRLFAGPGSFEHLSWTPDGRWVLVAWREADQWVFIRSNGGGIRAVSDISEQFRSRSLPRVEGWCCAG